MKSPLALIPLLLVGSFAVAQENNPELVTVEVVKDLPLVDLLDSISKQTGRHLVYDPSNQRIRNRTVGSSISRTVPKARLFDTYASILSFYELTLVPVGPKGYEIYLVNDSRSTNLMVKNRPEFVDHQRVGEYADRHGKMIATVLPIRNMDDLTQLRTAFTMLVTPAGIGRVMEVRGAKALIVMDFAPNVAVMARIVAQLDTERDDQRVLMRSIELKFAKAEEMAETLMHLLQEDKTPSSVKVRYTTSKPRRARVVAYAPRNSIAVYATAADMERIESLVANLDQPAKQWAAVDRIPVR